MNLLNDILPREFISRPMLGELLYPAGRALTSDWSVDSFAIVVYENIFFVVRKFWPNLKKNLIDNHYKTICGPVRSYCSSCRMFQKLWKWGENKVSVVFYNLLKSVLLVRHFKQLKLFWIFFSGVYYDLIFVLTSVALAVSTIVASLTSKSTGPTPPHKVLKLVRLSAYTQCAKL